MFSEITKTETITLRNKLEVFSIGVRDDRNPFARLSKITAAQELAREIGFEIPAMEQSKMLIASGQDFTTWSEAQQHMSALLWREAEDRGLV